MTLLTPKMALEAREALKLSQAKVARETSINRAYLSQFEGGKRVLEDQFLTELYEYYTAAGWSPGEQQSAEHLLNDERCGLTIMDGFVIPEDLNGPVTEELLDEYYSNSKEIEELKTQTLERGFFGGFDENRALSSSVRPLVLMARQCEIKQIIQGQYAAANDEVDVADSATIDTVGDYIEALLLNVVPQRQTLI